MSAVILAAPPPPLSLSIARRRPPSGGIMHSTCALALGARRPKPQAPFFSCLPVPASAMGPLDRCRRHSPPPPPHTCGWMDGVEGCVFGLVSLPLSSLNPQHPQGKAAAAAAASTQAAKQSRRMGKEERQAAAGRPGPKKGRWFVPISRIRECGGGGWVLVGAFGGERERAFFCCLGLLLVLASPPPFLTPLARIATDHVWAWWELLRLLLDERVLLLL
jgi:hypothetical protein